MRSSAPSQLPSAVPRAAPGPPGKPLPPPPRTPPPKDAQSRPLPPLPADAPPAVPPRLDSKKPPIFALPGTPIPGRAGDLASPPNKLPIAKLSPATSLANRNIISPRYGGVLCGSPHGDATTASGSPAKSTTSSDTPPARVPGKLVVPAVFADLPLPAPSQSPRAPHTAPPVPARTLPKAPVSIGITEASQPPVKERPVVDLVLPPQEPPALPPPLVQALALSPRVPPSTPGLPELSLLPSVPAPDVERRGTRRRKSFLNLLGKEDINPAFEQSDVFYKGYLYKKKIKTQRTISTSTWKRRFFVLKRAGLLFYYNSQTATTPLGFMDVNAAQIQNEFFYENKFVWEIHGLVSSSMETVDLQYADMDRIVTGRSDSYMIASETQQEKDGWVAAFREFAPAALPPAPPPAPPSIDGRSATVLSTQFAPSPPSQNSLPPIPTPAVPPVPTSAVPPAPASVGGSRKDLRTEVMNELVETEKAYVRDLNTVILLYKNNPVFTDLLSGPTDVATVFSNIEVILSVNVLLQEKLEQLHQQPLSEQNVGVIFMELVSAMKVYITYCSNHPAACQRLQELRKSASSVTEFLEKMRMHPTSKGLDLESMLIKPLQRICKYPLLLRELIKYTPEDHKHYAELKRAMEKLEELLMYLNEKKRESEALARLVRIHNSLVWKEEPVQLVMPSRKLLLKGKFARIFRDDKVNKTWSGSVMLFNDLVLVTKKLGPKKHQCITAIPINLLLSWADGSSPCNFVLLHTDKRAKFTVTAASPEERQTWEDTVAEAINNATIVTRTRDATRLGKQEQ